jgi:hypothetical protein
MVDPAIRPCGEADRTVALARLSLRGGAGGFSQAVVKARAGRASAQAVSAVKERTDKSSPKGRSNRLLDDSYSFGNNSDALMRVMPFSEISGTQRA